jgi:hypothetical protein
MKPRSVESSNPLGSSDRREWGFDSRAWIGWGIDETKMAANVMLNLLTNEIRLI